MIYFLIGIPIFIQHPASSIQHPLYVSVLLISSIGEQTALLFRVSKMTWVSNKKRGRVGNQQQPYSSPHAMHTQQPKLPKSLH
jgi:hypothetical protein